MEPHHGVSAQLGLFDCIGTLLGIEPNSSHWVRIFSPPLRRRLHRYVFAFIIIIIGCRYCLKFRAWSTQEVQHCHLLDVTGARRLNTLLLLKQATFKSSPARQKGEPVLAAPRPPSSAHPKQGPGKAQIAPVIHYAGRRPTRQLRIAGGSSRRPSPFPGYAQSHHFVHFRRASRIASCGTTFSPLPGHSSVQGRPQPPSGPKQNAASGLIGTTPAVGSGA